MANYGMLMVVVFFSLKNPPYRCFYLKSMENYVGNNMISGFKFFRFLTCVKGTDGKWQRINQYILRINIYLEIMVAKLKELSEMFLR